MDFRFGVREGEYNCCNPGLKNNLTVVRLGSCGIDVREDKDESWISILSSEGNYWKKEKLNAFKSHLDIENSVVDLGDETENASEATAPRGTKLLSQIKSKNLTLFPPSTSELALAQSIASGK